MTGENQAFTQFGWDFVENHRGVFGLKRSLLEIFAEI